MSTKENRLGGVYASGAMAISQSKIKADQEMFNTDALLKPLNEVAKQRSLDIKTARENFERNKPKDYNVQLLDGSLKERFTDFANQMKDEYNVASQTATSYSSKTNSPEYKEAIAKMEKIKTALEKNYNGLKGYQEDRSNRMANSGREVAMGVDDQITNDLIISEEGYNYITPTIDGPVWNDGQEGSENVSLGELFKPDYMDNESADIVTDLYITNPIASGEGDVDPELFTRKLKNSTFEITNDKALVRRITFNGLSNDPDTRFIDYYVAEQSLLGNLPDVGIIDINDDGKITAADRGENGKFSFENNDSSKFELVIENLKNDKNFDPSKELGIFLEKIGQDKFNASRQAKDDSKVYKLDSYGKITKKGVRSLFEAINDGQPLSDQNNREWRKVDGGWVTSVKDDSGNEVDSKPVSTAQIYKHLDLTLYSEEFGYDRNGNPLNDKDGSFNETSSGSSDSGNKEFDGGINNSDQTDNTISNKGSNYLSEEDKKEFFSGNMDLKKGNRVAKSYIKGLVKTGFDLFGQEKDLTPTDYQYMLAHIDPMGENFSIEKEMTKREKKQARNAFYDTEAGKSMINELGIDGAERTLDENEGVYYKTTTTVAPSPAFDKWLTEFNKSKESLNESKEDSRSLVVSENSKVVDQLKNQNLTESQKKFNKENHLYYYNILTNPKNKNYGELSYKEEVQYANAILSHLLEEHTMEELESGSLESPWYSFKATPAKKFKAIMEVREKALANLNSK